MFLAGPVDEGVAVETKVVEVTTLWTAEQMAEALALPNPNLLLTWARRGLIPSVKLGHYVRFEPSDRDVIVASMKRGVTRG